ncbi:sulfurtransferase TusA family protein [Spongiibacter sp. KMU-166]|uniref:Sulfurtransferase TusA family protein n=1 Tax=Spongiibacter thalassae TaxID=2721624 RepID=A0ABX1GFN1_9GAMM|nr:sulfurtransferase TusA family protein [Spongiibacter thalassae]NKI17756.1 sulfurtransferase TusA family protein [Spongiibacter thalassae]
MSDIDVRVDACGLDCPLPLLKAKQALNRMAKGEVLELLATDAGSQRDFTVFAQQSGNPLLLQEESDGVFRYLLKKN